MTEMTKPPSSIVRNSRGLSVAETRITLYSIMDHIRAGWPPGLIRDWFNLTDKQMGDVMNYIETHRSQFEAEYELVLHQANEIRQYWEERNRKRLSEVSAKPAKSGQEQIRARLKARKAKWEQA